jgi:hypothetical protein
MGWRIDADSLSQFYLSVQGVKAPENAVSVYFPKQLPSFNTI